jgi:UDP-N-acetylglucosamine 2-epimerase (non-hydrolysing)
MRVLLVVGARPNYMKVAPIVWEWRRRALEPSPVVVDTGQHYDDELAGTFQRELALGPPDYCLGVGSKSHSVQTAEIMRGFEPIVERESPDWVVVVGDVNSTLACALVATKSGVAVAHVEAGLRSDDWTMPEEINRVIVDRVADLLLAPDEHSVERLRGEGCDAGRIRMVGNIMIDSLTAVLRDRGSDIVARLGLAPRSYGVVTLHRPSNVDRPEVLAGIIGALRKLAGELPLVFPVHPRTQGRLAAAGIDAAPLRLLPPAAYVDFIHLLAGARLVLTDSGGIQEETSVLGVPCLTLRHTTERPVTLSVGTNRIVGSSPETILAAGCEALRRGMPEASRPPLWDGRTAKRVVDALFDFPSSLLRIRHAR